MANTPVGENLDAQRGPVQAGSAPTAPGQANKSVTPAGGVIISGESPRLPGVLVCAGLIALIGSIGIFSLLGEMGRVVAACVVLVGAAGILTVGLSGLLAGKRDAETRASNVSAPSTALRLGPDLAGLAGLSLVGVGILYLLGRAVLALLARAEQPRLQESGGIAVQGHTQAPFFGSIPNEYVLLVVMLGVLLAAAIWGIVQICRADY
jgi:hypothetical protein